MMLCLLLAVIPAFAQQGSPPPPPAEMDPQGDPGNVPSGEVPEEDAAQSGGISPTTIAVVLVVIAVIAIVVAVAMKGKKKD